ncbi:phosphoglycerate mutase-like protein [Aspergillus sclerotioniger CBS 115572]|uniref:Phosphoglycerate mutase-like protein n=1 Tax=Aspergillus sclerotioniger CBS 115572 TaxID=1450535 RepID=A0A317WCP1_9EURO|nr:phosphoglycerate mutase-like protein [Aspergillus sclerotioniger CBS 115572]PWY83127.1 phosphoglycerate mutase-like protein [Aspergillus sclerotioniger CBS 115572]
MKLSSVAPLALALAATTQASYINYTTVTGYFLQDEESTDASTFDFTATNFGLINRTYPADKKHHHHDLTQWERFYRQVVELNHQAPSNVDYKVLFLGRHGEGWHNAAEDYYGTPAWNCYWSLLDGNGTATWCDADLTTAGVEQAEVAHNFWQTEIDSQRIHTPDSYFVSPLTRALRTANITFTGLRYPTDSAPFQPLIKEFFREGISIHTCDNRGNRTYIHDLFPSWPIEQGFTEEDELWNGVTGETSAAQDVRSKDALDSVFKDSKKSGRFVSVTSHSGEISSILRVIGHRTFSLSTGAVIPVLVRAETIREPEPIPTSTAWSTSAHCTAPPVTSVASCVCASSAAPVTTPLVTNAY